jgi:hypothetical protein
MPGKGGRRLFRSRKVLLEDGLQEAGILVGQEGKIDRILRKDELLTIQHDAEVRMRDTCWARCVAARLHSQGVGEYIK